MLWGFADLDLCLRYGNSGCYIQDGRGISVTFLVVAESKEHALAALSFKHLNATCVGAFPDVHLDVTPDAGRPFQVCLLQTCGLRGCKYV